MASATRETITATVADRLPTRTPMVTGIVPVGVNTHEVSHVRVESKATVATTMTERSALIPVPATATVPGGRTRPSSNPTAAARNGAAIASAARVGITARPPPDPGRPTPATNPPRSTPGCGTPATRSPTPGPP